MWGRSFCLFHIVMVTPGFVWVRVWEQSDYQTRWLWRGGGSEKTHPHLLLPPLPNFFFSLTSSATAAYCLPAVIEMHEHWQNSFTAMENCVIWRGTQIITSTHKHTGTYARHAHKHMHTCTHQHTHEQTIGHTHTTTRTHVHTQASNTHAKNKPCNLPLRLMCLFSCSSMIYTQSHSVWVALWAEVRATLLIALCSQLKSVRLCGSELKSFQHSAGIMSEVANVLLCIYYVDVKHLN
jgi:hypothetical protein